ncbi:MAG TPA: hypothetical protein VGM50_18705 [Gemmatimonadaceae bacterium]|jgi:hypothetical protein
MAMSRTARLISNLLAGGAYAAVYAWSYVAFLHPNYESAGYDLFPRSAPFWIASIIITLLPVLGYRGTRAISSIVAAMIYLVLYVPIILTFAFASEQPLDRIVTIQLTFMVGMLLLFLADWVIIESPFRLNVEYDLTPMMPILTAVVTAYILFVYRGSLGFPSFGDDLYVQRADNESLGGGFLMRYLSSWLTTVLVPLCLAHGLTRRKYFYVLIGSVACFVQYIAAANKFSILLPFIFVGFYLFARKRLASLFMWVAGALCAITVGLVLSANYSLIAFAAAALLLMRTIGNGGQLAVAYYDFFSTHTQTGFSHVSGLALFTRPYPYGDLGVGQVIGQFYWSPFMNANASFWATDGLAAMGLPGVLIVTLVFAMVLVVMNSVSREYGLTFTALAFIPFIAMVMNQSLFSALLSGGAIIMMLFMAFNGTKPLTAIEPSYTSPRFVEH